MRYEHTVHIDAPADLVWRLTTDVAAWPSFVPTVRDVQRLDDGPLRVGSATRLRQPGQSPAVWTVTRLEAGQEFAWQTTRFGLTMTGSHRLDADRSGCRNTLTIEVAGRGSRLFGVLLGGLLRKAIRDENAGFKREAERLARHDGGRTPA
jgi:uncharacterized membrane protein